MIERSGAGSVPRTNESGAGRPKTDHTDPDPACLDPDPQR